MIHRIDRTARQDVYARIDRRFDDFVEELRAYARVPTISAGREAEAEGAEATRALLERHGVQARLMDVPGGPPLVVGEVAGASSGPPLILYNHYDVQPVDPLEQWCRAPFDPIGQALMAACQDVFGRPPAVFPWMRGSSSTFFYTSRGTPAALPPGVGYSGSLIHAPNEHIRLEDARSAIKAFAALMLLWGRTA
jgi:acetylornithine deacetylase/succinyl-diaminopimelate desuccinylase-like protein